jgi:hypothetical protein
MREDCGRCEELSEEIERLPAMNPWICISDALPPDGKIVETKRDDVQGCRNVQTLKRFGRLWFLPDGKMYVYYTPTHWRALERP